MISKEKERRTGEMPMNGKGRGTRKWKEEKYKQEDVNGNMTVNEWSREHWIHVKDALCCLFVIALTNS